MTKSAVNLADETLTVRDARNLAFGRYLKQARLRAGIDLGKNLAKKIGVTRVHYSRIENGDTGIRHDLLVKIIVALNLPPQEAYAAWLNVPVEYLQAAFSRPIHDEVARQIGLLAAQLDSPEKELVLALMRRFLEYCFERRAAFATHANQELQPVLSTEPAAPLAPQDQAITPKKPPAQLRRTKSAFF